MDAGAAGTTSDRPVVTLFEQYGAGADDVGRRVAEALGVPFHGQAFSSADLEAGPDATTAQSAVLARVYSTLGGAYGGFGGREVVATQQEKYDLVMANNQSIWADAADGGVIVGRNATVVLATRPSTVHVLLMGSVDDRVRRAAREAGITTEQAADRQRREDQVRAEMSQVLYGWDPHLPERYDMVVSTTRIPPDVVVRAIVETVRGITGATPPVAPGPDGAEA